MKTTYPNLSWRFKEIPEQHISKLKLATLYKMINCHKHQGLFQEYKDGLTIENL